MSNLAVFITFFVVGALLGYAAMRPIKKTFNPPPKD